MSKKCSFRIILMVQALVVSIFEDTLYFLFWLEIIKNLGTGLEKCPVYKERHKIIEDHYDFLGSRV